MIKRIIMFIILLTPFYVNALDEDKIVEPTNNFYVNDYANILSQETEDHIMNQSVNLEKVDGTQIVVVTIKNLGDISLEDYAYKLFNTWGIGDKEKQNGLLLLLSKEDRLMRVEVGNGLEGILPDGKTGRFQDEYIIPYLKDNKWDEGIKNGYDAFYKEIVTQNNLKLDYTEPVKTTKEINGVFTIIAVISGIFMGILLSFLQKKYKYIPLIYLMILFFIQYFNMFILFHFIACFFTIGVIAMGSNSRHYHSGFYDGGFSSGGGYSSGGFSGGGFSGGGGSSSGGGSSRGF